MGMRWMIPAWTLSLIKYQSNLTQCTQYIRGRLSFVKFGWQSDCHNKGEQIGGMVYVSHEASRVTIGVLSTKKTIGVHMQWRPESMVFRFKG